MRFLKWPFIVLDVAVAVAICVPLALYLTLAQIDEDEQW